MHLAAHPRLRRGEEGLEVAADRLEVLPLVHEVAVLRGDALLDAQLAAGEHELLELAMGGEDHLRRRRLEGDPPLDAEDRLAEVDAAADAERARRALSTRSMSVDGSERLAVEGDRHALLEGQAVARRRQRRSKAPRVATQAASGSGDALVVVSLPPIVVPQRPRLTE